MDHCSAVMLAVQLVAVMAGRKADATAGLRAARLVWQKADWSAVHLVGSTAAPMAARMVVQTAGSRAAMLAARKAAS